jgi:hypothetical protein
MRNLNGFSFLAAGLLATTAFAQSSDLDAVQVPAAAEQEVNVAYKAGTGVIFSGEHFNVEFLAYGIIDYMFWARENAADISTFAINNFRLGVKGQLHHTNTKFKFQLEGQDAATPTKDLWIDQALWSSEGGAQLRIRAGQQKANFGREWIHNIRKRSFVTQSLAASTYSGARTPGGQLRFLGKAGEKNNYEVNVGVWNTNVARGTGAAGWTGEGSANTDNEMNFSITGRYDVNGMSMGSGQGDLARSEELKFSVGAGLWIGNENNGAADVDTFQWNVNGALATGGIYAQFEVFGYDADIDGGGDEASFGWTLQGDYTLADMIYFGARLSMVTHDDTMTTLNAVGAAGDGTPLAKGDRMRISVVGGKFFNGHYNKIQAEVTFETIDYDAAGGDSDNIIFALRYVLSM